MNSAEYRFLFPVIGLVLPSGRTKLNSLSDFRGPPHYIDLAEADPVGGNTLSGGLLKSGTYENWQNETSTVLIDGLDEARLRVTQEAFEAFLSDVAEIAAKRRVPTVLFGRTGAIQDAWIILSDQIPVSVLEIGYYDPAKAEEFALARLVAINPKNPHLTSCRDAIGVVLGKLRENTAQDGDRFAGYAPVLKVVADEVAQSNPAALIARIKAGGQPITLQDIVKTILDREHEKLTTLTLEQTELMDRLYLPEEQLHRLVARVYRQPTPGLPKMSPNDAKAYSDALEGWVPEHPFLDGGNKASSSVFEAVIAAQAVRTPQTSDIAITKELARGAAANPFLSEFYFLQQQTNFVQPEHIGVIYSSMRARLSLGDTASLTIDGTESTDELEALRAEIEISITRGDMDGTQIRSFESEQAGRVRLGSHTQDVDISAPQATVDIGGAQETVLVAPVSIQCGRLELSTERLIVESPPGSPDGAISLEADQAETGTITGVPILNGEITLSVSWPNSMAHPWTSFSVAPSISPDPRVDEALRRFRKFVIAFRSHSKGSLKRYRAKLEHERMTKGSGRVVLNHMISTGIISADMTMFTLHPEKLAELTAMSYSSCMSQQFTKEAEAFVSAAIS
ncbi:hypothetical protein ACI7CM_14620 [Xanthobacter sp. AM33]|uniref:hypothetical protein n=1 Tax=Xanthobacter sp. AM33 TaxID=3380644 RepID=UPI0039BF1B8D